MKKKYPEAPAPANDQTRLDILEIEIADVLPGRISITYTHDIAEAYAVHTQFLRRMHEGALVSYAYCT